MKYQIKAIIDGQEVTDQAAEGMPSITNVEMQDSVSDGSFAIGSAAINRLTLTLLNGWKEAYDGDMVEFYISEQDEIAVDRLSELMAEVESETEEEPIDDEDIEDEGEEEEEAGEDLTEEEEAEAEAEETELDASIVGQIEGESEEAEEETTEEEEEATWQKMGTFFVYSQKAVSEGIQLTCYDSMIFLVGSTYTPEKAEATVQAHFDAFRAACLEETGITVEDFTFSDPFNEEITWSMSCDYRDAMGYFAGLVGGFAHADEDGEVGISFYLTTDDIILKEELVSYKETSAGGILLDGLTCNRSTASGLTTDTISTGAGQAVSWTNPYVTEEMLTSIYEAYRGIRYTGATVSARWNTGLDAGTLVRVMTEAEAENWFKMRNAYEQSTDEEERTSILTDMAKAGRFILIGTQTITFGGEAISTITSASATETAKENEMVSPWKKATIEVNDTAVAASDTANTAQISAESATNAAETAQTAAEAAQSTATTASTAAAEAQAKAEAADAKADDAAKTATDYLAKSGDDLVIAPSDPTEPSKGNLKILDEAIEIRTGEKTLARYDGDSAKFYGQATERVELTTKPENWGEGTYVWRYAQVQEQPTFTAGLLSEEPIDVDYSQLSWKYETAVKPTNWGKLGCVLINIKKDKTMFANGAGITVIFETPAEDGTLYWDLNNNDASMLLQFRDDATGTLTNITKDVDWKTSGNLTVDEVKKSTSEAADADYFYVFSNQTYTSSSKPSGSFHMDCEFYKFTGNAMTKLALAKSTPDFVDGAIYRATETKNAIPATKIAEAGINLAYGDNLYYRDSVAYGDANTTASDYSKYYDYADGMGMVKASTATTPTWKAGYVFTYVENDYKQVPASLGALTFVPNLFSEETTVTTETAEFGGTGATVGPKNGAHATFDSRGMGVYIDANTRVALFSSNWALDMVYPVGSIYMTVDSRSPADLFGGTWEKIEDKFLLSAGATYTVGETGGETSVTLAKENLPAHTHGVGTLATASAGAHTHKLGRNKASVASGSKYAKPNDYDGADDTGYTSSSKGAHTHKLSGETGSTGSGEAFSIMPPYMAVNVWTRVA